MTTHREVQPERCEKCNGTGQVHASGIDSLGAWSISERCDKEHVTSASFVGLVRDRQEARDEVEVLRAQLARARDEALEEAAKAAEAYCGAWSSTGFVLATRVRALKSGGGGVTCAGDNGDHNP